MQLVADYLERILQFERMGSETRDPELKQKLLKQAEEYWKLATKRAARLGVPPPSRPSAPPPK